MSLSREDKQKDGSFKFYPNLVNRGFLKVFPEELGYSKMYQLDK